MARRRGQVRSRASKNRAGYGFCELAAASLGLEMGEGKRRGMLTRDPTGRLEREMRRREGIAGRSEEHTSELQSR